MDDNVIRIEGLGKKYQLGTVRHDTLRDMLSHALQAPFRHRDADDHDPGEFWALHDVSFSVKRGDVVGIIGRNGAGKSTLLKILSRITEPTTGRIAIRGRVASLLEVGTGFHPELTGRENVFLNGAILGMPRADIHRKFDDIVSFAEITRFVDTPVKHYSSGMYVRLAFAVAAHLEPDILIVDEVLSVGDAQFQQKCLGKIDAISRDGRTVIFVSHTMGTVAKLCSSVVLLREGRVDRHGDPATTIARYLDDGGSAALTRQDAVRAPNHPFILHRVEILNAAGEPVQSLPNHEAFRVRLSWELTAAMRSLRVGFRLHAHDGSVVLSTTDCDGNGGAGRPREAGTHVSEVEFPPHFLNRGRFYLWIGIDVPMVAAVLSVDAVAPFSVEAVGGALGESNDNRLGVVAPLLPWRTGVGAGR